MLYTNHLSVLLVPLQQQVGAFSNKTLSASYSNILKSTPVATSSLGRKIQVPFLYLDVAQVHQHTGTVMHLDEHISCLL